MSRKNDLIISVHIHKNAGMNFKKHLMKMFGRKLLLSYGKDEQVLNRFFKSFKVTDYFDKDLEKYDIIHGHFLSNRFDHIDRNLRYATFLRHPVERVVSNYYFFKRNFYKHSPICNMIANGLTLEEYIELKSSKNVQSFFIANRSIEKFDYIGICEDFKRSLLLFDKTFKLKKKYPTIMNITGYFYGRSLKKSMM